jgi:uncharacterized repeat protein (TIGR04138 family)
MMQDPDQLLADLLQRDRRYRRDAYLFVLEVLHQGRERLGVGEAATGDEEEAPRHVTGQQLCEAIRQYAVQQFGLLAKSVLNEWGVRTTGDFGEIVFNLIDIELVRKTESDRRQDFDNVFDFDDGLRDAFLPIASDS